MKRAKIIGEECKTCERQESKDEESSEKDESPQKERKIKICYDVGEDAIGRLNRISKALKISPGNLLTIIIRNPRSIDVLERAVEEMEKLEGGNNGRRKDSMSDEVGLAPCHV
jgi:hypothetical protein